MSGWVGVDLDGTLAYYDGWKGETQIGPPIPEMVARVRRWLEEGREVRIFTARVAGGALNLDGSRHDIANVRACIEAWAEKHIGTRLQVTCVKDFGMVELWDDRCVRVIPNTGRRCCGGQD